MPGTSPWGDVPRSWWIAAFLALLLAGCAGPAAETATTSHAAATRGDLRGVVVDPGIRPLAGAFVQVSGNGVKVTTNTTSEGTFIVRDLAVGSYFLLVKKTGFLTSQTPAQVNGTDAIARIALEADPTYRAPTFQTYKHVGIVQCGVVVSAPPVTQYAAIAVCDEANRASGLTLSDDTSQAIHILDAGAPTFVQSELDFSSDQAVSHQLLLYVDAVEHGGTKYAELGSAAGASPVAVSLLEGRTGKLGKGSDLQIRVFPWYESPSPLGATYDQKFEVVSHVFYGYRPPEGWLFSRDGVAPAPK